MTVYIRAGRDKYLKARFGKCGRTRVVYIRRSAAEHILGEPLPEEFTGVRIRPAQQGKLHILESHEFPSTWSVGRHRSQNFLCIRLASRAGLKPGRFDVKLVHAKGKR